MIVPEGPSLSRGRSSSKPRPVVSGLVVAFVLGTLALVAVRSVSSTSGPAIKIDVARVPPEKVRSLLALADGTPSLHHLAALPAHLSTHHRDFAPLAQWTHRPPKRCYALRVRRASRT